MAAETVKKKGQIGLVLFIVIVLLAFGGMYYMNDKKKKEAIGQAKLDAKKISQAEFDERAKAFEKTIRETPKYLAMLEGYIKDPEHGEYGWTLEKSIATHGRYEVLAAGYSVKEA